MGVVGQCPAGLLLTGRGPALAIVAAFCLFVLCFPGMHAQLGASNRRLQGPYSGRVSPGRQRMGKLDGKTDIGESAPCSKMGRAQVRKGGVLWIKLGLR